MSPVVNFLSENSTTFHTGIGSWTSGTNQLSITRVKVRAESNSSSLKIYDATGTGASASVQATPIPSNYQDWPLRGFAWVNSDVSGEVSISLLTTTGAVTTETTVTESVIAGNWTLLSVEVENINPEDTSVALKIQTSDTSSGDSLFISRPAIMSPWAAAQSFAGGEVWLRLPEYIRTADSIQENPTAPLFKFIEAIFNTANSVDLTWQNFRWIPPELNDRTIKESGLVSPGVALPPSLVWMAQAIGSTLLDPTAAYTPWLFLDDDADPSTPITWADWIAAVDFDEDGNATWDEIQDYNPAIFDLTTTFADQVSKAYYGYKAGTTESIIAAALAVSDVSAATVIQHYSGDPFHIGVEITGGSTVDVGRALVDTTPAGFQVTVVSV